MASSVAALPTLAACERAAAALAAGRLSNRKRGRRKALYPLDLDAPEGEEGNSPADHLLKVNDYRGGDALRRRLTGSKARLELQRAETIAARGIPTPVPIAAGEARSRGRVVRCLLLVRLLPDVVDLRQRCEDEALPAIERRAVASALGHFSRRVHEAGIFQDDFAPNNFLVSASGTTPDLWMIDFERARIRERMDEPSRLFNLAKLYREIPGATAADRLRFLQAYHGDPKAAREGWAELSRASAQLARRDQRRMARVCVRDGRRFQVLRAAGLRGYARSEAPEALRQPPAPERFSHPGIQGDDALWWVGFSDDGRFQWQLANFLHARDALMARPLASWGDGRRSLLWLARPAGAIQLAEAPDTLAQSAEVRAAHRLLIRRTVALGTLREAPSPERISLHREAGGLLRASWLPPLALELSGRPTGPAQLEELLATASG